MRLRAQYAHGQLSVVCITCTSEQPDRRRSSAPGMLRRSAGRSGTGGAESLLLRLALGRRCGEEAPHFQDHPGRTVSEATEPACTGVTGGVCTFLGQSTPAPERGAEPPD